jgi:hypothetical protein
MKNLKMVGLGSLLFVVSFLPQVQAQQEVDPTWYDPWSKPAPVATHAVPVKAESQKKLQKVSSPSPETVKVKKIVRDRDSRDTMHAQMFVSK